MTQPTSEAERDEAFHAGFTSATEQADNSLSLLLQFLYDKRYTLHIRPDPGHEVTVVDASEVKKLLDELKGRV